MGYWEEIFPSSHTNRCIYFRSFILPGCNILPLDTMKGKIVALCNCPAIQWCLVSGKMLQIGWLYNWNPPQQNVCNVRKGWWNCARSWQVQYKFIYLLPSVSSSFQLVYRSAPTLLSVILSELSMPFHIFLSPLVSACNWTKPHTRSRADTSMSSSSKYFVKAIIAIHWSSQRSEQTTRTKAIPPTHKA